MSLMMRSDEFLRLDKCDGLGVVLLVTFVIPVAVDEAALVAVFSFFSLP